MHNSKSRIPELAVAEILLSGSDDVPANLACISNVLAAPPGNFSDFMNLICGIHAFVAL